MALADEFLSEESRSSAEKPVLRRLYTLNDCTDQTKLGSRRCVHAPASLSDLSIWSAWLQCRFIWLTVDASTGNLRRVRGAAA